MDLILILLGFCFCLAGIAGSLLPVIPGPPLSWLGLLLLQFTNVQPFNGWLLGGTAVLAIGVTLLDYWIPVLGTRKFGGSRAGMIGTVAGLLLALVFPVMGFIGILVWPFVGALFGELLNRKTHGQAMKSALGSFIGFLAGTLMKFLLGIVYLGLFLAQVWKFRTVYFSWFF